jgi:signal transduction histidine kinase
MNKEPVEQSANRHHHGQKPAGTGETLVDGTRPGMAAWPDLAARFLCLLAIAIAIACLFGWAYDIDVLMCVGPGLNSMKVNAAAGIIIAGLGQLIWMRGQPAGKTSASRSTDRLTAILGCCLAVLAILTLCEYLLGIDLGIDNLWVADLEPSSAPFPGRMSGATAIAFLAIALSLITELTAFTWLALSIAGFAAICYLLDLHAIARLSLANMALHTSIALILLGVARIMAQPRHGMMQLLLAQGLGGAMARVMLPVAILAPIAVSWLAGFSQRIGLLDGYVSAALGAILGIILLTTMVFMTGRALTVIDLRRRRAELELRLSHDALEAKVRERTEELRQARDEANGANRHKSVFLAHMSHELRTPLNAILGFADIMRREQFGAMGQARYVGYADDIHHSGSHLLSLINDILDLSKIEAGKFDFCPQPILASGVAKACRDLIAGLAKDRDLRLLVDVPADLPPIETDERAIKQILINLLSNAIKFTPAGGIVELAAELRSDSILSTAPSHLVFRVRDTGIGMSESEIAAAQMPFGQIQNQFSRTHKGTGLGLFLAKQLTELQAGYLEIDSMPGAGTTVSVGLPLQALPTSKPITERAMA